MSDALLEQWSRDAAAPFEGWDFSYLSDRMDERESGRPLRFTYSRFLVQAVRT